MTVKTNPIKLAYRIPKTNYKDYATAGIGLVNTVGETVIAGTDSTYVYLTMTAPYNLVNGNYVRWQNFGQWGGAGIAYNLTLASGVAGTPDLVSVEYYYSDIGWSSWKRFEVQNTSLPVTISKIRYTVASRPYVQSVHHYANCDIPANTTTCTVNWSTTLAKGTTGYIHGGLDIYNPDSTLRSDPDWAEVNWNDLHYPTIATSYNAASRLVTLNINQPNRGLYFDRVQLGDVWLANNGTRLSIVGTKTAESGEDYTYTFDLDDLPQGNYTLSAVAKERHGPTTTKALFSYYSDKTPPTLKVQYKGGAVPNGIETIKDLRVIVTDSYDTAPVVSRMTISGGPINDALDLGFSKLTDGWVPEVPRMFPTLEVGQEYTLNVTAKDAQGNTATISQTFSLSPSNLVRHGAINLLPASQSLLDINDKPLGTISFKGALTSGGSQSRGPQAGYFTLRRDSAFAVMFNGTKVAPGETKDVVIPLDATGSVTLPVWPADTGVKGKASYMLDIPQLTAN
ncbi:Ig-like domain-containing protein [Aeromonas enteropelogenes]